jgi:hypothetical protein
MGLMVSTAHAAEPPPWPKWVQQLGKPSQLVGRALETDLSPRLLPSILPAGKPKSPVPPTLEIEVLDPNADPMGNPAVELVRPQRDPCCDLSCDDGPPRSHYEIDIPPVVIVHRYYYTGDRSFRGPMLPGGPSIVVVNHPKTGQRCYIPVQMLPGSPTVHYSASGIEYDYGTNGIALTFGRFTGEPKVVYRNRVPVTRQAKKVYEGARDGACKLLYGTGVPQLADATAGGAKNLVGNVRSGVADAAEGFFAPGVSFIKATPLGSLLASNPEEQARRQRDRAVQAASRERLRAEASLGTLR